jgi:hypothetical protein
VEMETFGRRVTRKVFSCTFPFRPVRSFRELECGEKILQACCTRTWWDSTRSTTLGTLNAAKRILGLNYESLASSLIGVSFQGQNGASVHEQRVD